MSGVDITLSLSLSLSVHDMYTCVCVSRSVNTVVVEDATEGIEQLLHLQAQMPFRSAPILQQGLTKGKRTGMTSADVTYSKTACVRDEASRGNYAYPPDRSQTVARDAGE